jgi:hypothetical protein
MVVFTANVEDLLNQNELDKCATHCCISPRPHSECVFQCDRQDRLDEHVRPVELSRLRRQRRVITARRGGHPVVRRHGRDTTGADRWPSDDSPAVWPAVVSVVPKQHLDE